MTADRLVEIEQSREHVSLVTVAYEYVPWLIGEIKRLRAENSEIRWRAGGGMVNDVGSSEPTWRTPRCGGGSCPRGLPRQCYDRETGLLTCVDCDNT